MGLRLTRRKNQSSCTKNWLLQPPNLSSGCWMSVVDHVNVWCILKNQSIPISRFQFDLVNDDNKPAFSTFNDVPHPRAHCRSGFAAKTSTPHHINILHVHSWICLRLLHGTCLHHLYPKICRKYLTKVVHYQKWQFKWWQSCESQAFLEEAYPLHNWKWD